MRLARSLASASTNPNVAPRNVSASTTAMVTLAWLVESRALFREWRSHTRGRALPRSPKAAECTCSSSVERAWAWRPLGDCKIERANQLACLSHVLSSKPLGAGGLPLVLGVQCGERPTPLRLRPHSHVSCPPRPRAAEMKLREAATRASSSLSTLCRHRIAENVCNSVSTRSREGESERIYGSTTSWLSQSEL